MDTLTISDVTTTSLSGRLPTLTVFHIFMGSRHSSLRLLYITVDRLNKVGTLVLGLTSLNHMEDRMRQLIAMQGLQHSRFKEWCQANH